MTSTVTPQMGSCTLMEAYVHARQAIAGSLGLADAGPETNAEAQSAIFAHAKALPEISNSALFALRFCISGQVVTRTVRGLYGARPQVVNETLTRIYTAIRTDPKAPHVKPSQRLN